MPHARAEPRGHGRTAEGVEQQGACVTHTQARGAPLHVLAPVLEQLLPAARYARLLALAQHGEGEPGGLQGAGGGGALPAFCFLDLRDFRSFPIVTGTLRSLTRH